MYIIPDLHCPAKYELDRLDEIIDNQPAIFLGDYFDNFNDTLEDTENMCKWLNKHLERDDRQFILGNHDVSYFYDQMCPGWTSDKQKIISKYLNVGLFKKKARFHVVYKSILCTHAGFSRSFMKEEFADDPLNYATQVLEKLYKEIQKGQCSQHPLLSIGRCRGGKADVGGVIWCDIEEFQPIDNLTQIFGHSPLEKPKFIGSNLCLDTNTGIGELPNFIIRFRQDSPNFDIIDI